MRDLLLTYERVLADYEARQVSTVRDPADKEVFESGASTDDHYLSVGREALELIIAQLIVHGRQPPEAILDLPCGSGRVTRHLRAAFPDATIGACDLYPAHVDFCTTTFAALPIPSNEDFDEVVVEPVWDVVFVGSLLTHLPRDLARKALGLVSRSLSPTGLALVTVEGRRSIEIQQEYYKLISDDRFRRILRSYRRTGHGFAAYDRNGSLRFDRQSTYGVALVSPQWMASEITKLDDVRLLGYIERAWDNHQDVAVFGRPGATGLGH